MKKLLSLFAAAALAVSLAGCGVGEVFADLAAGATQKADASSAVSAPAEG